MANPVEQSLESVVTPPFSVGELIVRRMTTGGFVLSHRDNESLDQVQTYRNVEDAVQLAKYDEAGNYRPLKTAPNLQRGWQLELATMEELIRALDYFYPGRLAIFAAWKTGFLKTTALRETLERQSGMYRVAAQISDEQINDLVANFCRSDGGCLRTILWKRDQNGVIGSTKLPRKKFDPASDQAAKRATQIRTSRCDVQTPQRALPASDSLLPTVPLLCQEACNLLVAECRKVVKSEKAS